MTHPRQYLPREPNPGAEAEFLGLYTETPESPRRNPSPWGQSDEMDELIDRAQRESPASDSTFLGVMVLNCTQNWRLRMLVDADVTKQTVELVANTTYPRNERTSFSSRRKYDLSAVPWAWNDKTECKEMEDGRWSVTFYGS